MIDPTLKKAWEEAHAPLPDYTALIPYRVLEAILTYVLYHHKPGHFVTAFLSNDLTEAIGRADEDTIKVFRQISWFTYNEIPGPCWKTPEAVKAWLAKGEKLLPQKQDGQKAVTTLSS